MIILEIKRLELEHALGHSFIRQKCARHSIRQWEYNGGTRRHQLCHYGAYSLVGK